MLGFFFIFWETPQADLEGRLRRSQTICRLIISLTASPTHVSPPQTLPASEACPPPARFASCCMRADPGTKLRFSEAVNHTDTGWRCIQKVRRSWRREVGRCKHQNHLCVPCTALRFMPEHDGFWVSKICRMPTRFVALRPLSTPGSSNSLEAGCHCS